MFNAEKLLGKIVSETLGSGSGGSGRGGNGLLDTLTSGQGLMTMIGLGVGAYEILKEQQAKGGAPGPGSPPPPPSPPGAGSATPPPPPGSGRPVAPVPPAPPSSAPATAAEAMDGEELARRMIQVMIGAAHADGRLDEAEEKAILDRLRGAELSSEEKMYLLEELHHPRPVAELTRGIDDPAIAKTMYMLAVAAVEVDTEAERQWLDELGTGLGLSPEVRRFIEEQV